MWVGQPILRYMTTLQRGAQPSTANSITLSSGDADRIRRAIEDGLSDNTLRAYTSQMRQYKAWLIMRGESTTDLANIFSDLTVAAYLTHLHEQGSSPSKIESARAAIVHEAGEHGYAEALRGSEGLRRALRGVRRTGRRSWRALKARALSPSEVRRLVDACVQDSTLAGLRDRALILLGVSAGLRSSDLITLQHGDVRQVEQGIDLTIRYSKTNSLPVVIPIARLDEAHASVCPVRAIQAYMNAIEALHGVMEEDTHLFRAIRRGGFAMSLDQMSAEACTDIICKRAQQAHVEIEGLSSHSMRSTFATNSLAAGIPESSVARVGRWSSLTVLRGYDRSTRWSGQVASGWLGMSD